MLLQNNPFYLLKVSCTAGRREIMSASDEMSFVLDPEICSNALNALTNPNKRLDAEINWFIDLDADSIAYIRSFIENAKPISTEGLSSLSKLNAMIYNFLLSKDDSSKILRYCISLLDRQYSSLDSDQITQTVNKNRSLARFNSVQKTDVEECIRKKREEIRQLITEKLSVLGQDRYVELITVLAEDCMAAEHYETGAVISDVIDQYEVRIQSTLEESTKAIEEHIAGIKNLTNDDAVSDKIKALIYRVQKWDKLAQPLQLKSQLSGLPHRISERLGSELRNLALYLNNEKGMSNEALELVSAMQGIFAELGTLSELLETDVDTLNDLLRKQKDSKEFMAEYDALKKEAENLKSYYGSSSINSFIDHIKKLDLRLKAMDLALETKTEIREAVCYLAKAVAIELHNSKQRTDYALIITKALLNEFGDIPSLRSKLNEDLTILNQQTELIWHNPNTSNSPKRKINPVLVIIGILVLIAAFYLIGGSSSKSSSDINSASMLTSSAVPGDFVYTDIVSIFPGIGIGKQGSNNFTYFVCKCTTSDYSTVWVHMTCSEYKKHFDSSASYSRDSKYATEIGLSPPKRIYGTVWKAEGVAKGLSSEIGTMLIHFSSVK